MKRRTRTVGIFPDSDSVIRLVGMVLLELDIGKKMHEPGTLGSIDIKLPEEKETLNEIEEMVPECVGAHTPH